MVSKVSSFLFVALFVSLVLFASSNFVAEDSFITGDAVRGVCIESDDGLDYENYGELNLFTKVVGDSCEDEDTLKEYYCRTVTPKYRLYDCEKGTSCLDGACVPDVE